MAELRARGFLFDMDGTLLNSVAVVERLWIEVSEQYGMSADEVIAACHGRQAYSVLAEFLGHEPVSLHRQIIDWFDEQELVATEGIVAIAGAAQLLESLRAQGAPFALVTSANRQLAGVRLAAAGLAMPDIAITADRVQHSKPDPEGFLLGASALGIDAASCVAFEDADAGMQAVLASGAQLVAVGDTPMLTDAAASARARIIDYTGVSVAPDGDDWVLTLP